MHTRGCGFFSQLKDSVRSECEQNDFKFQSPNKQLQTTMAKKYTPHTFLSTLRMLGF